MAKTGFLRRAWDQLRKDFAGIECPKCDDLFGPDEFVELDRRPALRGTYVRYQHEACGYEFEELFKNKNTGYLDPSNYR